MAGTGQPGTATLGALLRRHREWRGLTQEALAERAGGELSVATVSNLERGRTRPYPHTLAALATALGLSEAEREELLAARQAAAHLPAASPSFAAIASALPVPLTPLVGREHEVAAVAHLLHRRARLVTLTGPGGVGKTRLALRVAEEVAAAFPDGVVFVELAPLRDPALVLPTLAGTLGMREGGGVPTTAQLATVLRGRRLLLVLDNLEQVAAAGPDLAALLTACADLAVLATSRAALRVRGEREFPVPPLALPDPGGAADPASLAAAPAVNLFVQRAQAAAPAFRLTADNAPTVAALCARLDGLPLALELAAPRLRFFTPWALLARLDRGLATLSGGAVDLPARQRALRDTLAWSEELLVPVDQALFRGLGVFVGGGLEEAVAALVAGTEIEQAGVFDGLARLVDTSLVFVEEQAGEVRYRLLETVRQYARERLEMCGEAVDAHDRHAAYYLELAEGVSPRLFGAESAAWLGRLEREHDNLRAALEWLMTRGEAPPALRLGAALAPFWWLRGYLAEGRDRLVRLLALPGPGPRPARAAVLLGLAVLAWAQGDYGAHQQHTDEALAIFQALGDTSGGADALCELGAVAFEQGRYDEARALLEESLVHYRTAGDQGGTALALQRLASVARDVGEAAAAGPLFDEALALRRAQGDRAAVAHVLSNLGWLALHRGDLAAARAWQEESLAIRRELGDRREVAVSLTALGRVSAAAGDLGVARALYGESLPIHGEAGHRWGLTLALEGLAGAIAGAQPQRAARLAGAAAALRAAIRRPLPPVERPAFDALLADLQRHLAPDTFAEAWASGGALTMDEALAEAEAGSRQLDVAT